MYGAHDTLPDRSLDPNACILGIGGYTTIPPRRDDLPDKQQGDENPVGVPLDDPRAPDK